MHGEVTYHPVQSVLDDDIAGMIGRFVEGVKVNDETLAIDLIEEVGPIPGTYIDKDHTFRWWKVEQFLPRVADKLDYNEWKEAGKKFTFDYANERMEEIISTHSVSVPLTLDQEKDSKKILEDAKKYYKKKDMM